MDTETNDDTVPAEDAVIEDIPTEDIPTEEQAETFVPPAPAEGEPDPVDEDVAAVEEPDLGAPDEPEPAADEAAAWQLTLPDVDSAGEVPVDEVVSEAEPEAAQDGAEEPEPDEAHLFELSETDESELTAIAASVSDEGDTLPGKRRSPVPWWPYLVYIGLWVALGVAMVVLSNRLGDPYLPESRVYLPLLAAGLFLAIAGPFTGLIGWGVARRHLDRDHRAGLLSAALLRAAMFTLGGVVLWWAAFVLVDALRLGWL